MCAATPLTCASRRRCLDLSRASYLRRCATWTASVLEPRRRRPAMDTGQLHAIDAPLEKGRRFTHLTGAPSIDISLPDTFSSASTCALPLLQLAKWPQCDLMECWAACQFRWTSPDRSQVVSSHNAHVIVEPSTSNWRFSSPSTAVNRLPITP